MSMRWPIVILNVVLAWTTVLVRVDPPIRLAAICMNIIVLVYLTVDFLVAWKKWRDARMYILSVLEEQKKFMEGQQ